MEDTMDRAARYFDGDYADFIEDLPLIQGLAERVGDPILELGCGTGRLLVPLAEAGHSLTGIDLSGAMLAIAEKKLRSRGLTSMASLIKGDFSAAGLGGPFRLVFSAMNTFMHLTSLPAQLRALRHWREHLAPGGLLVLDLFNPDVAELASLDGRIEFERSWTAPETGHTIMKLVSRTASFVEQTVHMTLVYDEIAPDGALSRTLLPVDMRYLWRFEAELLLDMAGYRLEAIYGDWDLGDLVDGSPRMILVAQRTTKGRRLAR